MRVRLVRCVLLLVSLTALSASAASRSTISAAELRRKVDAYVRPFIRGNNFSGAILISRGGQVLLSKGYGVANYELGVPNTPRIRFHIASVSKSFTAAAILLLEQQGRLSVRDPLSKYIPDYPNGDRITLHHLLTHHSGIPNINDMPEYEQLSREPHTLAQLIDVFKRKPPNFDPGAKYAYSNSNYNLLAYVIEKVSGKGYGEFLRETIFGPLDMKDTGHDASPTHLIANRAYGYVPAGMRDVENAPFLDWSVKTGNGSIYSTVEDLYKWDRALYTDKILNKAAREKMFTDYGGFGYGFFVRTRSGRRTTAINGRSPGFTSSLERYVDEDICVILVANTYSGLTHSMADVLAAIVFGEKYESPRPPASVAAVLLRTYAGRYQFGQDFVFNPGVVATVEEVGGQLRMISGVSASYLIPQSDTSFLDRLYGGVVSFRKNDAGQPQLTWSFPSFGSSYSARKLEP